MNLIKANLPYIYIPSLHATFLIDTGSTRSLIDPELAYKFYNNFIYNENFNIQTAHNTTYHNEVMDIPIFDIFGTKGTHKFYLFKFNAKYEGLIGVDFLRQIKAQVDLNQKLLKTPYLRIPIIYEPQEDRRKSSTYDLEIEPRTTQKVKLPVNLEKGTAIINYFKFGKHLEMPEAIVDVVNSFAITTITNSAENPLVIKLKSAWEVEPLNEINVNFVDKMQTEHTNTFTQNHDDLLKGNLKNIRLDHCNLKEKQAIRKLCYDYRDIFYCEDIPLSFTNKIKHRINFRGNNPIYTRSYRLPEIYREEVKDQINKMLEQNIIQPSDSPWSSPIWVVPKKMDASGRKKWRLVVDYRKLNDQRIEDKYPLPNITDILDKLGKACYFSVLDLASGFHKIEVDSDDVQKTAFSTERGHYEYKRMPFGLRNAPSTFQRVMDNILRGLQDETCLVYLDDIIIYSTSLQEHLQKLKKVFEKATSRCNLINPSS